MFAVEIFQSRPKRTEIFTQSIETLKEYIFGRLNQTIRVADGNDSVEISTGTLPADIDDDHIVAELMIRKRVVINTSDFTDELELDKFLQEIKHFCEQAKSIEDVNYLPPPLRQKPEDSS